MNFLTEALIFLVAALIVVPVCKQLGLSAVLGYLGAGIVIGPYGLGLIGGDPDELLHFAEIGVVFLLFIIGLEVQPRRLWLMRKAVFGLGALQVITTSIAVAVLVELAMDLGWPASILVGFALALSSTAFVLQLLGERHTLNRPHGRASFGVLLFQDVAVIPAIAIVSVLGGSGSGSLEPLKLLAVLAGIVLARYTLRPALRFVASTGISELFGAASLTLVVGAALAMYGAGLSMGLGAFIAGMLVADSEYRHQLETDVMPFKGLLLGLFFMAVGISTNMALLAEQPAHIAAAVAMLVVLKALVLFPLARWHGLPAGEALRTALILSQGGEFAFVLLTTGVSSGLVASALADQAILVVTLSMITTPFLVSIAERWLEKDDVSDKAFDEMEDTAPAVIIAGFGRFGQIVARVLSVEGIPFTALEADPNQVELVRQFGNKIYFGDSTRLDLLRSAGVANAKVFVLAIDDPEISIKTANLLKEAFPNAKVLARARDRFHELSLRELGVKWVIRETLLSSLEMTRQVLISLGSSPERAERLTERFRQHDQALIDKQSAIFHDEHAFRQSAKDALEELKQLIADDKQT